MAAAREPFGLTPRPHPAASAERSPWHSPVPYLFGGLAAMLGLIAFALLILACSYWKLSGQLENGERDLEAGEGETEDQIKKGREAYEEKVLVIMAGQVNPTFLATPASSSRTSSFGDGGSERTCRCGEQLDDGKQGSDQEEEEEEEQSGNRGGLRDEELPSPPPPTATVAEEEAERVDTTPQHY